MNKKYGYVRVSCVVPELKVANVEFNVKEIIKTLKVLDKKGVNIVCFPELCITGYTCGDLFKQEFLLDKSLNGLKTVIDFTTKIDIISILGIPLRIDNYVYNCAVVVSKGEVLGIVPKSYIGNKSLENRWFKHSNGLKNKVIKLFDKDIMVGNDLIFRDITDKGMSFGINIGDSIINFNSTYDDIVLNKVAMMFNMSASNELIGKYEYRKNLYKVLSNRYVDSYMYVSSGVNESSTDFVYSGYAGIYENGKLLVENERFRFDTNYIIQDVDIHKLINIRNSELEEVISENFRYIDVNIIDKNDKLMRNYAIYPFVPSDVNKRDARCLEVINMVSSGLIKRLKHVGTDKCVMGISGGLDSTLAFLLVMEAYKRLGIDNKNFIGVTMPGFGTSDRTYNNAVNLMKSFGVTIREINIKDACLQHFSDIGIDPNDRSVAYENAQARERTQILMDIANMENGLVIGTGDLSELVLGWCTYNGDHMSMYSLNGGIPKTLVRYLVDYFVSTESNLDCKKTIQDILDTPISPELLPPNKDGNISQQTESLVGPYVLHDFFLYHFLRYGASPEKIKYMALQVFNGKYTEEFIVKWLKFFIKRFFSQQFKRNSLPDGVKIGTIGVSPRGDLLMPSDANYSIFIENL